MLKRLNICKIIVALTAVLMSHVIFAAADPWQMNMHKGVTPLSHDMYDLHMVAIVICAIIGVIVFGIMIYSLIHHRKSKGYEPATFHDNTRLEIVWTIIPFLILFGLAIPATKVLIRLENTEKSDVTIKVVGHQWKWQYQYLDEGISFFSNLSTPYAQIANEEPKGEWYLLEVDKEVIVPVHKKIRFLVTSNDVIHSWWVPELGVKRDAIPGFMHEAWARIEKPGVYRGQCAELCGINHAYMPIVVRALPQNEYDAWVKNQTIVEDAYKAKQGEPKAQREMTREELMKTGKEKYDLICSACHKVDGTGLSPLYPALKGSSVAVGKPISRHISIILDGVPGSAMQSYRNQLSDVEIAALVTYERNAWGNNTDDVIQPAEVAQVRKGDTQEPTMVKKAQAGGLR